MGTSPGAAAVAAAPAGVKGSVFEPPFPIPESWAWTRLGTILKVPPRNGYSPKPVANKTKTKRLTLTATTSGIFKPEEFKYVADEIPFDSYLWLKPGDLLVQRSNSIEHIGTSCIFTGKPHEYIYPDLMMKLVLAESLDVEFFDLVLKSDNSLHYFQRNATGSAGSMPKINKEILENTPIPLPPISEQHAIVARFKKLSSLCERIDTAAEEMNAISRHAKSRILDLAIRGDLMPQDPTDEPASVLLDRIRSTADKPPCTKLSHETLFQIPESWVWTTLDNVICPTETTAPSGTTFTYIDIDAIDNKENTIKDPKTLLTAKAPSRARRRVSGGDTIFSMVRPYLRNIAKVPRNLSGATASTGFFVCRPSEALDENYLFDLMRSNYVVDGLNQFMKGDNSPSISGNHILKFPIPLPPLAEQRRIAEKVNELFASIDSMITK